MQLIINALRQIFANPVNLSQLSDRGLLYLLQTTKVRQQRPPSFGPNPVNTFQYRVFSCLLSGVTVPAYGETVRLIPDVLYQVKGRAIRWKGPGVRPTNLVNQLHAGLTTRTFGYPQKRLVKLYIRENMIHSSTVCDIPSCSKGLNRARK